MTETLAKTTVNNYRSRLRLLKKVLDNLPKEEQDRARLEIMTLEAKLGSMANAARRPGRPRLKAEIPEEVIEAELGKTAANEWSPEAIEKRVKAKREALEKSMNALQEMKELLNEEETTEGARATEQGDGRTGQESERGTSEERGTKG